MPSIGGDGGPMLRAMLGLPPDFGPSSVGTIGNVFSGCLVYVDTSGTPTLVLGEGIAFSVDGLTPDTAIQYTVDILSGDDALAVLPPPGAADETWTVGLTWDGTTLRWATQNGFLNHFVECATVLIPAGDADITHWTITDIRDFTPGFGLGPDGSAAPIPDAIPVRLVGCANVTSTTLVDTVDSFGDHLSFTILTARLYEYEFGVLFTSADVGAGLKLGLTFPSPVTDATSGVARIPISATTEVVGPIVASGDSVAGTGVAATGTVYLATIHGQLHAQSGTLHVQHARGGAVSANIQIHSAWGRLRRFN